MLLSAKVAWTGPDYTDLEVGPELIVLRNSVLARATRHSTMTRIADGIASGLGVGFGFWLAHMLGWM